MKDITKAIKKAKARARVAVRARRNEDMRNERKTNPRRYWFKVNQWLGKQKRGMPSVITYEGKEVKGGDKLRAWRQMFQGDSMQEVDADIELWIRNRNIECELRSESQHVEELDEEIQWFEVERAVKQLKIGKAPGEDEVIAELLKGANEECIRALWQVFARCFEQEEIPEEWARGLIVPIPKNAEVRKVENYRGITLLSIVGKTYVAVLNDRLKRWMEDSKVVVEEQAGFREGYSPVDQVYVLSEIIQRQKRRKKAWYCAFLDIKRAYDVVWRDALWVRLWMCGVRGKMWRVIRKLYAKTESCVLVENQRTEWSRCDVGVRQGCVMSPNLFSLFINGMAEEIKAAAKGIAWADKRVCLLMFADDVVLLAEEEKDLETMLEVAHRYSKRWRFQFNAAKCKVMANRRRREGAWKIGGEPMAEVESFVYLGVEFGKRKGSKEMKSRVLSKVEGRIRKVDVLRNTYGLGIREALRVWDAIGRPVMEYGAEVWANAYWREGERALMRLGRRLMGVRKNTNQEVIQGELGLWRMKGRWDLARLRLWRKLVEGKNVLASWVYRQSRLEFEQEGRTDTGSWCWYTWQVLKSIGREMDWDVEHVGGVYWSKEIMADMGRREEKEWRARVEAKPRLRSYKLIKVKLELEEYLEVTAGKRKAALVEMRSGANDLEIERGRRRRVEVAERVCAECKGGVEDEMHLVLECPAYEQIRKAMLAQLSELGVRVRWETREMAWSCIMSGEGYARWRVLGQGVAKMLAEREKRREERGEETG